MTIVLKYEETKELLRAAVAEKGEDYVYHNDGEALSSLSCLYVHQDGNAGCIIGNILLRKGVDAKMLREYHNMASVHDLIRISEVVKVDSDKTMTLLARTQASQDNEIPWGFAVEGAISSVEEDYANEDS